MCCLYLCKRGFLQKGAVATEITVRLFFFSIDKVNQEWKYHKVSTLEVPFHLMLVHCYYVTHEAQRGGSLPRETRPAGMKIRSGALLLGDMLSTPP